MARTGALEASSEGSIPSSPTHRVRGGTGIHTVLRRQRPSGLRVRLPPNALLPLPVEPDVGLRSRQVEFDSRLGLTACQSRRSARLPVTEEITGSSPVQAASCRCQWTWCRPCEGWMRRFDSSQWLVSEAEVVKAPGCEPGVSGFESRPTPHFGSVAMAASEIPNLASPGSIPS